MASAAPLALDDIPSLSLLYKLNKLAPVTDTAYKASAQLNDKISVIKQDITTLAVDAIVNAATNSLLGGGGVDGAIHRAAGSKLYDECAALSGCDTGSAKITNGYGLPSKKVIHTVGPVYWNLSKTVAWELLAGCYKNSLQLAVDNGCRSIAFPAVSTGIYGYPSGDACLVALTTVRAFLEQDKAATLDRVIFCNFLQKDEDFYHNNIPFFFPPVQDNPSSNQKITTEPSQILSKLPDVPTQDPFDPSDTQQPSPKKQKKEDAHDTDDEFVLVEKDDADEAK
ncbi:MACRO domain-containing protein 1 [Phaeosphaeriaceae sp. PMI808]|nr:MACRO domain-containing protein 1 [Phaeosphaeriaceae sp. PMI808]